MNKNVKEKVEALLKEKGWYRPTSEEINKRSEARLRSWNKGVRQKIKQHTGWSFRDPPELPLDYQYEILQYADNGYAFRLWKSHNDFGEYAEFWIHPNPKVENLWELYPRQENQKIPEWDVCLKYDLLWDEKRECFTKGVAALPLPLVNTIEMFNLLVRKIKQGFELNEEARIIYGESPFEEDYV